ncbi:glycosyltransferase [Sulfurimonas sp.]|uniref:glycosyltransferase n=1 Tax=Sulfurimonas sp. TaxID=2022749 RepID=UPI0035635CD0
MKVSLIVAVYKDIEALDLIVQALKTQTYKNFEFIIAEDNNSQEMKDYVSSIEGIEVKHTFQEDSGIRKMRSLNNAIIASEGDYLVFIDGDCIPYSTFIESHIKLAEDGYIVSGRRCNLGPRYAQKLRSKEMTPFELEKSFVWRFPFIAKDAIERHSEAGFYFSPDGFIYNNFLKNSNRSTNMLGCNYSCFKKDMLAINGYDEGYGQSAVGDDTDLQWRFKGLGLKVKSAKNVANIFHLYHERGFRKDIPWEIELEKMKKNRLDNVFVCKQGLDTHGNFVK